MTANVRYLFTKWLGLGCVQKLIYSFPFTTYCIFLSIFKSPLYSICISPFTVTYTANILSIVSLIHRFCDCGVWHVGF